MATTSTFTRGNPVTIVERFYRIDPITGGPGVLTDPGTIIFHVQNSDGGLTVYTYLIDPEITRISTGLYLLSLDPMLPPGIYQWIAIGTGGGNWTNDGTFTILEAGAVGGDPAQSPTYGPCNSWIDGGDVAAFAPELADDNMAYTLDDAAAVASDVMFELSGRLFPGVCTRTVRPCRTDCQCWGSMALGMGPWYWTSGFYGGTWWGWQNEGGDRCGCETLSKVRLAGYPVREILEVTIDGVVLPLLDADGNINYRLDKHRDLIRMDAPPLAANEPVTRRFWPGCQNLSLEDTESGTFSVKYTWGADVPQLGKMAACQLAREVFKAGNGQTCALPTKATKVVRQGVTIERVVAFADMLRMGSSGFPLVDMFIATVNPSKARRRPAIYSPDVQPYARKVG